MAVDKIWVLAEAGESGPTPVTLELLTEARSVAGDGRGGGLGRRHGVAGRRPRRVRRHPRLRRRRPRRRPARASRWPRPSPPWSSRGQRPRRPARPRHLRRPRRGRAAVGQARPPGAHQRHRPGGRRRRCSTQHPVFGGSQSSRPASPARARHLRDPGQVLRGRALGRRRRPRWWRLRPPTPARPTRPRIVARHAEERTGPKLDEAPVVVSGGRGLGAAENYALIEELASPAARRGRGQPGHRRRRVGALLPPGRPDRQDGEAHRLPGLRDLRAPPSTWWA